VVLADHVLVQRGGDRLGIGYEAGLRLLGRPRPVVLLQDLLAEVDAEVADVDAGTGDELADLVLAFAAEGAAGVTAAVFALDRLEVNGVIVLRLVLLASEPKV